MIPFCSHFFASRPFRPRFIFVSSLEKQEWVVSEKEVLGESGITIDTMGQDIEDLSKDLAKSAFLDEIRQEEGLAEKVPANQLERAIELVREDMKTILAGLADNAGRINDQIREIVRLSAAASARHVCERLRVEMENVLLTEENQELKAENVELAKRADFDFLTGLSSRRALDEKIKEEVIRADRSNQPLCVIMFDLDKFKEINTAYGHIKGGDVVLRALGHRFRHGEIGQKIMRDSDFVGRYGGDEIMILLPNTDKEGAMIASHRIVKALEEDPIYIDDGRGNSVKADIGASIGIGVFRGKDQDPYGEKMCIDADQCVKICKGEDPDANGEKIERRGHVAVNGEVYSHEQVEVMINPAESAEKAKTYVPEEEEAHVAAVKPPFVKGPR